VCAGIPDLRSWKKQAESGSVNTRGNKYKAPCTDCLSAAGSLL